MKLNQEGFYGIKKSKQLWETRLCDEKRKTIKIDDEIEFSLLPDLKEKIEVKVINIVNAKSFEELFNKINPTEANYPKEYTPKQCAEVMKRYYTYEKQLKYGVVGIKITLK